MYPKESALGHFATFPLFHAAFLKVFGLFGALPRGAGYGVTHSMDGELGPAMQALDERQRRFVLSMIDLGRAGRQNLGEAARRAGYSASSNGYLRKQGHVLSHDPRIQAALLEESRKTMNLAAAVVATPVAIRIALDKSEKASDRLRACEMLFNRGGMPAMTEHKVTVEHTANNDKMVALAKRLAAELGFDEARLIGVNRAAAEAIDAEFTEVPPPVTGGAT